MKNISWFINRLAKMSPAEVGYRTKHKLREKYDGVAYRRKPLVVPSVTLSLTALFDLSNRIDLTEYPQGKDDDLSHLLEQADQYLLNTVDIFGLTHCFGKQVDWHLDPKTKKHWPKDFWAKVNIRDGFTYGGPKFVWEVNRLYALPILGLAYKLTNERKYADKYFSLLSEWLEGNPYPYGVNWTSGIELGVRVANAVWGLSFLSGYAVSAGQFERLNTFMYTHAQHLFRYPSKYSSNNNHAIAEAFGLFLIGVYFPQYSQSSKWRRFGQTVLERECLRQILVDGGSYEYSSTYLSFVFDFFFLFKIVCDHQGLKYVEGMNERLEKSCEYIHGLMDDGGQMPNIGDQDSAVLVNFGLGNHANFKSILNSGSILFGRPEFRQDNFSDFKTFLLLGKGEQSERRIEEKRAISAQLFKESGLAVIRGNMRDKSVVFVGNATPLGMPPLYAHGHLDALSFTLSIAGKPFLIDPGTYLYHSGGKWRRYFRSTAAHNTIQINGQDLTDMPGDFMFGKPYAITEHRLSENNGCFIWQASHNAYRKLECGVVHTRKVLFGTDEMIIDDTLSGTGRYSFQLFFHFHPDCHVTITENTIRVENGGISLNISCPEALTVQHFSGSEEPIAGWFSQAFNRLEKTSTVVVSGGGDGDVTLRTKLQIKK